MSVNINFKRLLLENGISQKELAQKTGVSEGCISQIARGVKYPSVDVFKNIADTLGVTMDEIYS